MFFFLFFLMTEGSGARSVVTLQSYFSPNPANTLPGAHPDPELTEDEKMTNIDLFLIIIDPKTLKKNCI
jgi:hypothetical protein